MKAEEMFSTEGNEGNKDWERFRFFVYFVCFCWFFPKKTGRHGLP